MNIDAIKPAIILLALLPLISFCGCATPEAKQNADDAPLQTAGSEPVIVVPIFILSPPQNGTPGSGRDIPPGPISLEPTTRRGEPLPARL